MDKAILVLWEGRREFDGSDYVDRREIVCAFDTEGDLIEYIKNTVRDRFEIFGEDYFRMPSKDEFGPKRDIYFAHEYCKPIEHYFRYEVCELK